MTYKNGSKRNGHWIDDYLNGINNGYVTRTRYDQQQYIMEAMWAK